MSILLALAATAAAPQPGELKTFKDWTVGCDNGRACQAVGLLPEGEVEGATITVQRGAEANAVPRITITSEAKAVALSIDDALSAYKIRRRDGYFELAADETMGFANSLSKSSRIALVDARGKALETVSLAGASAALRYIDDRQKRVGSVTALVAKGASKAVSPPPPLPVVRIPPVTATPPAKFPLAGIKKYSTNGDVDCNLRSTDFKTETYRLDATHTLVMVPAICGNGAYNYYTTALIAPNAGTSLTRAKFDVPTGMGEEVAVDEPDLVNASYDPKTRRLSTYTKARGLGDCGVTQQFVWDGTRFRLVEQAEMGECRGSVDYIVTWRAAVR